MTIGDGEKAVSSGPWGGVGGQPWDDGVFSNVKQIMIAHGAGIDSIQVEYDMNGTIVWSQRHGGSGGDNIDKVKLEDDEFLTSIQGTYGSINKWGTVCVRSLTFKSNKKSYGPFGIESGTCFSLPLTGVKIVGFHGKRGWYLDAVGVHYKSVEKDFPKALVKMNYNIGSNGENNGYSLIHGKVSESYDIVVAVKQREASKHLSQSPVPNSISRQTSDIQEKNKKAPENAPGLIAYGPWGGTGGTTFDDGVFTGIRQINLSRNLGIVSMRVCYDHHGQLIWGSKHGGTGGFKHDKIIFDYPSEILTRVTGTYGPLMYMGPIIIRSLCFHTNKGKHGPFGDEQGPSFSNKVGEGKIVGFCGREGLFLDSIGVHVLESNIPPPKPCPYNAIIPHNSHLAEIHNSPWANKLVAAKHGQPTEVAVGVIKEPAPCGPGPWGGDGGKPWDDGVFSGIKQIYVTRSDAICSLQFEYDRGGQSVWSAKHGSTAGVIMHRIKLEYPSEVVTCISGYYGSLNAAEADKVIRSLTFYTSRGKYGPYGEEIGTYFTSFPTEGKVVGFHGRNGSYLNAIGVHVQHWLGSQKLKSSSLFKFF